MITRYRKPAAFKYSYQVRLYSFWDLFLNILLLSEIIPTVKSHKNYLCFDLNLPFTTNNRSLS
jgi:hypothetical protein